MISIQPAGTYRNLLPAITTAFLAAALQLCTCCIAQEPAHSLLPGFHMSPWFGEQTSDERTLEGVNVLINAPGPARMDPSLPTLLVLYATPNGNTIEQTMGAVPARKIDWQYDIQHVAAQIRRLREIDKRENIVVACLEAEGRSWPTWRQRHANNSALIRELVRSNSKEGSGRPGTCCLNRAQRRRKLHVWVSERQCCDTGLY